MTPDTFTIEQTQSPWCFCGLKRLSNSTSINIETCRTRWIHAHVPLMPLHWFSSYLFEGVLIYLGVAVLGAWTDSGYEDSVGRASQLDASAESLRAIRDVWFGGNLVAGTVACLLWWLFRLGADLISSTARYFEGIDRHACLHIAVVARRSLGREPNCPCGRSSKVCLNLATC